MKFIFILFLAIGLNLNTNAHPGDLQNIRISLDLQDVPLSEAFKQIEQKTDYVFFYKNADLNLGRKVTIKLIDRTIAEVLTELFKNQNVVFEIIEKRIIVRKTNTTSRVEILKRSLGNAEYQISGIVIDNLTEEPISYCNISLQSFVSGTASNELGEFVFEVSELPVTLVFSHINYGQYQLEIKENAVLVVRLEPLSHDLEEVVVLASGRKNYPFEIAKKALEQAEKKSIKQWYAKAFYRQKSKNGESYSEFSEIFYDIRYNTTGIEDWEIFEGRYALKENTVHNRNYTLFSRLLKPVQPNTDELIFPLHPEMEIYYDVSIKDIIYSNGERLAVLQFKPKGNTAVPVFEGEAIINTTNFNILKIAGQLSRDDLKLVRLKEKNSSWKNYKISYEISYNPESSIELAMDYVKVEQEFDYYKEDHYQFKTSSVSYLNFFEFYEPSVNRRLGRSTKKRASDWDRLDKIGYNEKFWENNAIVKRTPAEEEVITSFSKDKAFSSIYLNSNERVGLIESNSSGDAFLDNLDLKLDTYKEDNSIEKVFVHSDKEQYLAGENIWYSVRVVNAPFHFHTSESKVIHIELVDADRKTITKQSHELIDGRSAGSIRLDQEISSGTYNLLAYTSWMKNYEDEFLFRKELIIVNPASPQNSHVPNDKEIVLEFFPEGGQAVANLPGVIVFSARDSKGLPQQIKGKILDSRGQIAAPLNTMFNGLGFFTLNCVPGEQYKAELTNGAIYQLPSCLDKGYSLTVNNSNARNLKIKVQASDALKANTFYIVGYMRDKKFYQGKFNFGDNSLISFEIPKAKLPNGIFTLAIIDENRQVWSERPVFINNQEELIINSRIVEPGPQENEEFELEIQITDTEGNPVSTEFSIAVKEIINKEKLETRSNMANYLWLQSELRRPIRNIEALFSDQKRATLYQLDLALQTSESRKIDWIEVWQGPSTPKKFSLSKGLILSGSAWNLNNNPLSQTNLKLVAKSGENLIAHQTKTSQDGRFRINDFNATGSLEIRFDALNENNIPQSARIILDDLNTEPAMDYFNDPSFIGQYIKGPILTVVELEGSDLVSIDKGGAELAVDADKMKRGRDGRPSWEINELSPPQGKLFTTSYEISGHTASLEFNSANGAETEAGKSRLDVGKTMYWSPSVKTDTKGMATIRFAKPINSKGIQFTIEALSDYGIPGSYKYIYK